MGKDYNLSQIAKEYATKNECGLPLTPEQLLNSVVAYVNEEVKSVEENQFPFTTIGNESTFTARIDSYENNVIASEYTSDINGKKFTMKQPFGARANGGLSVDVDEEGNTLKVGIDMTDAREFCVLTSIGNAPVWREGQHLYNHIIKLEAKNGTVFIFLNILLQFSNPLSFTELAAQIFAVDYPCSGIKFSPDGHKFCVSAKGVGNYTIRGDFGGSITQDFTMSNASVNDVVQQIF